MKKAILVSLVLSFAVALTCQWAIAADNVVFSGSYMDPDTTAITKYYQKGPDKALSVSEGEEIANSLFFYTGATFELDADESTDDLLLYRNPDDNTGICYIDLITGKILFNKGVANYLDMVMTPDLPDDDDAVMFVQDHLNILNLYPKIGIALNHVGGLGMAIHEEDGTDNDYKKLVVVYEGRVLDGIQVVGSSRVVTTLGSGGELVGLGYCWVDALAVTVAKSEILDGIAIRDRLTTQLLEAFANSDYIEVQEQEVIYYDDGNGVIEPAVKIMGIVTPQGQTENKSIDWITSILVTPHAVYPYDFSVTQPADPPDPEDPQPEGETE